MISLTWISSTSVSVLPSCWAGETPGCLLSALAAVGRFAATTGRSGGGVLAKALGGGIFLGGGGRFDTCGLNPLGGGGCLLGCGKDPFAGGGCLASCGWGGGGCL